MRGRVTIKDKVLKLRYSKKYDRSSRCPSKQVNKINNFNEKVKKRYVIKYKDQLKLATNEQRKNIQKVIVIIIILPYFLSVRILRKTIYISRHMYLHI